jgi:hypothetical protein
MSSMYLSLPANLSSLPMPDTGGEWKPFWEGTARGALLIQQCTDCGQRQSYPRLICTSCGGEPSWLEASGRGVVHTFTVIRQNQVRPFSEMAPYVVAIVELREGVRMMTNIVDCQLQDVRVGMKVKLRMVEAKPDVSLPYWVPDDIERTGRKA